MALENHTPVRCLECKHEWVTKSKNPRCPDPNNLCGMSTKIVEIPKEELGQQFKPVENYKEKETNEQENKDETKEHKETVTIRDDNSRNTDSNVLDTPNDTNNSPNNEPNDLKEIMVTPTEYQQYHQSDRNVPNNADQKPKKKGIPKPSLGGNALMIIGGVLIVAGIGFYIYMKYYSNKDDKEDIDSEPIEVKTTDSESSDENEETSETDDEETSSNDETSDEIEEISKEEYVQRHVNPKSLNEEQRELYDQFNRNTGPRKREDIDVFE